MQLEGRKGLGNAVNLFRRTGLGQLSTLVVRRAAIDGRMAGWDRGREGESGVGQRGSTLLVTGPYPGADVLGTSDNLGVQLNVTVRRRGAVDEKSTITKLGRRQVQVGSMCSLSITEHNPTIRMSKFIFGEPHKRCEHAVNTPVRP